MVPPLRSLGGSPASKVCVCRTSTFSGKTAHGADEAARRIEAAHLLLPCAAPLVSPLSAGVSPPKKSVTSITALALSR